MKRTFLLCSLLVSVIAANAQNQSKLYAITGDQPGSIQWTSVQQLDPATGQPVQLIYKKNQGVETNILDARTRQNLRNQITDLEPTGTMVAASAYDAATNRLYFTPMHGNQLRFFDLNAGIPTVGYVQGTPLKNFTPSGGEADNITRMTMASDGFGYALTNDGRHLIRFSTGANTVITDLGSLKDAPSNGSVSVHNQCSSWGGDMVGDAFGNLYLFSVRGLIFKINPATAIAEYKGTVKGLTDGFTINGAAVDANGNVTVSSSVSTLRYYSVDMNGYMATPVESKGNVPNASDLASAGLLFARAVPAPVKSETTSSNQLRIFPNPVTNGYTRVQMQDMKPGLYQVELRSAGGQAVYATQAMVEGKFNFVDLSFGKKVLPGIYTVRVIGKEGKQINSQRIIVQ